MNVNFQNKSIKRIAVFALALLIACAPLAMACPASAVGTTGHALHGRASYGNMYFDLDVDFGAYTVFSFSYIYCLVVKFYVSSSPFCFELSEDGATYCVTSDSSIATYSLAYPSNGLYISDDVVNSSFSSSTVSSFSVQIGNKNGKVISLDTVFPSDASVGNFVQTFSFSDVKSVFASGISMVGKVSQTVVSNPVLLLYAVLPLIGIGIIFWKKFSGTR